MQRKHSLLFICILGLFFSCREAIAPQYKEIKNISVTKASFQTVELKADVLLYNPNIVSVKITYVDISLSVNGNEVSTFQQNYTVVEMPPKSDFTLPLDIEFPLSKILTQSSLSDLFNSALNREFKVNFSGKVRIKVLGVDFNVPIKGEELVKI